MSAEYAQIAGHGCGILKWDQTWWPKLGESRHRKAFVIRAREQGGWGGPGGYSNVFFSKAASSSLSTGSSTNSSTAFMTFWSRRKGKESLASQMTGLLEMYLWGEHNHASIIIKVGMTAMRETCTHIINMGTTATGSHSVPRYGVHSASGINQLDIYSS